jgi:hypothetical protein
MLLIIHVVNSCIFNDCIPINIMIYELQWSLVLSRTRSWTAFALGPRIHVPSWVCVSARSVKPCDGFMPRLEYCCLEFEKSKARVGL